MAKKSAGLILMVVGVALAGIIAYQFWTDKTEAPQEVAKLEETTRFESDIETPTEAIEVADTPTAEVIGENTVTASIQPTARLELESTDPTSVNLASGDIQLIELFAFW